MSSTAPVRSLIAVDEPSTNEVQLPPPVEPADSPTDATHDDMKGVERLLSALESKSLALVPYAQYAHMREVPEPKSSNGLLAGALVAVWLSTMVFGVAYMRYSNHASAATEHETVTRPIVIPSSPDPEDTKVANTVDHLQKVLATSSERISQLEAQVQKSNSEVQRLAGKLTTERSQTLPKVAVPAAAEEAPKAEGMEIEPSTALVPRNWHRVVNVKPTETAVAHHAADGGVDYWQVPRSAGSPETAKVLPIGSSIEGVVVHCLDDGKDYTITPSGEWRSAPAATANTK